MEDIPLYMKSLEEFVAPYVSSTEILNTLWEKLITAWKDILQYVGQFLGQSITGIINTTFTITSGIFNLIISFVSYFILSTKRANFYYRQFSQKNSTLHIKNLELLIRLCIFVKK